ncbi:MAG: hypothetical protein ABH986_05670 [archaeon]
MQLNKKHYAAIAFAIIFIGVVLISQFPLEKPELPADYEETLFNDVNEFEPDPAWYVGQPSETITELNYSFKSTGCLGEIKNNEFIPDERNPTEEQMKSINVVPGKNSLKIEYYGLMFCEASTLSFETYIDLDGFVIVAEGEAVDDTKFDFGPTTAPPEERFACMCNYKGTVEVTGLESKAYPVVFENKDGDDWLIESVEVQ